jgi:hypothetical protein
MDPTHEPHSNAASLPDEAIVAFLRDRAPGLPAAPFDPRAVTARARGALRRLRRRRIRNSILTMSGAAALYLVLAVAGPLLPGAVNVPGGESLRTVVAGFIPGLPPGPARWPRDVDRLDGQVRPVVEELQLDYYLLERGPCRILEYPRGDYRDGAPECHDLVPFDAQARADFDRVTAAVERSGVAVERIYRYAGGIYVRVDDTSWQYNWEYVYLPDGASPPPTSWPEDRWTHVRGDWWFHRAHDD